jgi:hypothetical protein
MRGVTLSIPQIASVLFVAAALCGGAEARAGSTPEATHPGAERLPSDRLVHGEPSAPESAGSAGGDSAGTTGGPTGTEPTIEMEELQRQIEVLAEEVEKLRSGEQQGIEVTEDEARALGLAPSAASLYRHQRGVSLAGYGEMLYEDFSSENESGEATGSGARVDFLRAILYAGYRFNQKFLFNSEIEIEHADEISVEFAYVDYLASPHLGLRGGMLLLPMGLVNEFHEPTVSIGARRPETEQAIIPTTWRENGLGVHGSAGKVTYRAYLVNGLRASRFSANGIRGGRQKGAEALADDLAFTGRLDVTPTPGLFLGVSLYTGGSGQGEVTTDGRNLEVGTTIFDIHGQAQAHGFDLRGLYARARIDDAAALNASLGLEGPEGVAETMVGGYVQLGYNVLSRVSSTTVSLLPYYRWEGVDTQAKMPSGFERSGETRRTLSTLGIELKPIPSVVVKLDYQIVANDAETGQNQLNVSLGYAF